MDFGPLVPANNPAIRELAPNQNLDMGRPTGPRVYSDLPSHESPVGESLRILRKRKWVILGCLALIFSVVAIASLKMPKVYEANGTIEINKPDPSLNFQNSTTFSLDYFDPTELETDMKILQSDPARASGAISNFKGSLRVNLSPNTRIIEVHYRSHDPQMASTVVNNLMQTFVENNFKARFDSTMQASDWLQN